MLNSHGACVTIGGCRVVTHRQFSGVFRHPKYICWMESETRRNKGQRNLPTSRVTDEWLPLRCTFFGPVQ